MTKEELETILKAIKICEEHDIKIQQSLKDTIKELYIKLITEQL